MISSEPPAGFLRKPSWWGVPVVTRRNILRTLAVLFAFAALGLLVGIVAALAGVRADLPRTAVVWMIGESLFVFLSFILIWFLEVFFCLRCFSNSYGMLKNAKPQWLWNPFALYNPKSYTAEGAKYATLVLDGMGGATLAAVPILIAILLATAFGVDL